MAMMGISFSLVPAVMWPSVALHRDESRLGTAYALMTLIQQIGFFIMNLLIGKANDLFGCGLSNPSGYALGMWIFSVLGFVGLTFAILLRLRETGFHGPDWRQSRPRRGRRSRSWVVVLGLGLGEHRLTPDI